MKYLRSISSVIVFAWKYSAAYAGRSIWLYFIYRLYKNIHPIINAYCIKLVVDLLASAANRPATETITVIAAILGAYFLFDVWDNVSFRHSLVISRTLQRRLTAGIESDLAHTHASLPITTIEDPAFKDRYALVKRESSYRLFPLVDHSVNIVASIVSFWLLIPLVMQFSPWYLLLLALVQIPRIVLIKPSLVKVHHTAQVNAKLSRYWDVYVSFLESPRGSYESRILQIKDFVKKKLADIEERTVGLFERTELSLLPYRVITAIIPNGAIFAIGFVSAQQAVRGAITVGDWQFIINTCYRVSEQLKMSVDDIGVLAEAHPFVEDLIDVLERSGVDSNNKPKPNVTTIESLEFNGVWFRYPHTKHYALKDVTFRIDAQENIAIVGYNGAGKTTLIKLLCRFYSPTKGEIRVNGRNINEFDLDSYWSMISALFQEFESYGVSAYHSIGYGDINRIRNRTQIEAAAKLTGIHSYLKALPLGYKTPLIRDVEDGVGLSTGQWQKVAIARALFRPSELIILDEPTSNMDPDSEEKVFNQLIKTVKKRIMLLISHRFSTVRRADRILVFESGRLVEEGNHQQLMQLNGLYARLFRLQSERYQ